MSIRHKNNDGVDDAQEKCNDTHAVRRTTGQNLVTVVVSKLHEFVDWYSREIKGWPFFDVRCMDGDDALHATGHQVKFHERRTLNETNCSSQIQYEQCRRVRTYSAFHGDTEGFVTVARLAFRYGLVRKEACQHLEEGGNSHEDATHQAQGLRRAMGCLGRPEEGYRIQEDSHAT